MIIAGPCLYSESFERDQILKCAIELKDIADVFRCKLWGGGTTPEKFMPGMGNKGLDLFDYIRLEIMPVATEVQSSHQIMACLNHKIDTIWIGARNSQNYALIQDVSSYWPIEQKVFVKRGSNMTIDEVIGLYDIYREIYDREVYFIERGINTFDRLDMSRWSPDLKGVIRLKHERPDIFDKLIVDCSHSVGFNEWVEDTYKAFKSIGVNHFMFECTSNGISKTDQNHMISVKELKEILKND